MTRKQLMWDVVVLVVISLSTLVLFYCVPVLTDVQESSYEAVTFTTTEETEEYVSCATEAEMPTEEATEATEEATYTADDVEHLALVIYQEAGADYCSDETRLMVGTVVMNRVADSRFPDTIEGVLTQRAQYGRLYWTGLVWPDRASNANEVHAVERAYRCAEVILSGYRAFSEDVIWQAEFVQGTEIVAHQDGMYFCR